MRSATIALVLVAGELGQWSVEVRESDECGGESSGAIGGIWALEALGLRIEHRNGSYISRGGGGVMGGVIHVDQGEGRGNQPM